MTFIFFLVSFFASTVGAICGVGGGVIVKPVLDSMSIMPVATINFLSGCTVLSMALFSVGVSLVRRKSAVDFTIATPLAVGAAVGGGAGKCIYEMVRNLLAQPDRVGVYQSLCLALITLPTLLYALFQRRIPTHRVRHPLGCAAIGLVLGILSSFLGIGGGPVNLVVLSYFFSMSTKTAAQNSLYIILVGQLANLLTAIVTGSAPAFQIQWFAVMACGGIAGGIVGHRVNGCLDDRRVQNLFVWIAGCHRPYQLPQCIQFFRLVETGI